MDRHRGPPYLRDAFTADGDDEGEVIWSCHVAFEDCYSVLTRGGSCSGRWRDEVYEGGVRRSCFDVCHDGEVGLTGTMG